MIGFLFFLAVFVDPLTINFVREYAPDHFLLNTKTRLAQDVWNTTYPASIEAMGDEAMHMSASCRAVLSCPKCTQYMFECTPTVYGDAWLRIRFRTTATDYKREVNYGIAAEFNGHVMRVLENGRVVAHIDSVSLGSDNSERILIENFAGDYTITKGCRRLYRGSTTLPNTDGIVFETSEASSADIRHIIRNSPFNDLDWKR